MKLYNELFKNNALFKPSFAPLLMRYSVMEGFAAIKMIQTKPILDSEREQFILDDIKFKCLSYGFDQYKIEVIQQFFIHNMTIAKLIQDAFTREIQHQPKDEILKYALTSISKVTKQAVDKDSLLISIRLFIDGLTKQIIKNIESLTDDSSFDVLEELVENCFVHIDKIQLGSAIDSLKCEMNTYQEKESGCNDNRPNKKHIRCINSQTELDRLLFTS